MKRKLALFYAPGALTFAVLCWGLAPVATRYILQTSFSALHLLLLRFLLATLLLLPVLIHTLRHQRIAWTRHEVVLIVAGALTCILGYNVTVTFGLQYIPASIGGLLIATEPIWITLLACLFLHETLRKTALGGLVLATSGVVLLIGQSLLHPAIGSQALLGIGLTLLAAMMWGIYTIVVRPLSRRYGALSSTALTTIIGTVPLFAFWDTHVIPSITNFTPSIWIAFLLLAVGSTVVATILWNYGVAHLPGSKAGMFLYLEPVVSVLGSALFLGEHLTLSTFASGALIIAGVIVAQLSPGERNVPESSSSDAILEQTKP